MNEEWTSGPGVFMNDKGLKDLLVKSHVVFS